MRLCRSSALLALLVVMPSPAAPRAVAADAPEAGGTLSGIVTLSERLVRRPPRFRIYPGPGAASPERGEPSLQDEMAHVVISLEPMDGAPLALRPGRHTMEQSHESFVPHVLPIVKGSTVEFPNVDPMFHNVFSLSRASSFDLGRYPRGESKSVRFDEPGIVKVFCHIHSNMSGVIVVLETPYFTSPDADGRFHLAGLPAGEYRVVAWHERARPIRRTVWIRDDGPSRLDLDIPVESAGGGQAGATGRGR